MIAIDILFTYIYVKIIIGIELFLSYIHTDISLYLTYVYIYIYPSKMWECMPFFNGDYQRVRAKKKTNSGR